ncbi:MAG: FAD-dependent oxidoreductase, partial [Deltaproteobacteria bacterium]|nr:FAD-dependent oxidoreductase [Deltaproteobacteria bacterium]
MDLRKRAVRAENLETGRIMEERFDHLLIATGASPFLPKTPGINARGVYTLSTLQSGIAVREAVDRQSPRRVVLVGAGYIGLEMAENFIRRGIQVTLVEKAPQVMSTIDADLAALLAAELTKKGGQIFLEESLQGFELEGGEVRAVTTDRRTLPADLVVMGLGVRPNSQLARDAGISIGETGGIKVDEKMQTEIAGVWAAGNCTEALHLVSRRPVAFALGTVANKQGRVVGINIAGGQAAFPGVVGTAMVKVFDWEAARTGLQEREAKQAGISSASVKIEGRTRAGYYPGAGKIFVKLVFAPDSGRLLGGQIVGQEGAGKRIDVLATALHAGMTVE